MHRYRTHKCHELRNSNVGIEARLSGWVHRVRDHGHLVFIDLRDHFGITQCVVETGHEMFFELRALKPETVLTATGIVVRRGSDTINSRLPTGDIELRINTVEIQNVSETLPLLVHGEHEYGEESLSLIHISEPTRPY